MITDTEWLDTVKAGDKAVYLTRYDFKVVKVVRCTKTLIIIRDGVAPELRFRRKTGRRVGAGAWDTTSIGPVTDAKLARIRRNAALLKLLSLVDTSRLKDVSTDDLERAVALLQRNDK